METTTPAHDDRDELRTAHEAMRRAIASTPYDTPERAARRIEVTFGMYDDEAGEPAQALADLLTDLMHECRRRGVDFDEIAGRAATMTGIEIAEWEARS